MSNMSGRDAAINGLRQYRKELLSQLRQVEESIVKFGGTVEEGATPEPADVRGDLGDSSMGPQRLIEEYLQRSPGKFFRPALLAKRIVEWGYHPTSPKLWTTQVRNCLKRAVEKGIAETKTGADGKIRYGLKQETETSPTEEGQASLLTS